MDNQDAFAVKAKMLEDRGEYDLAIREYNKAIALGVGDQASIQQQKGRALSHLERFQEAIDACQQALALNPDLCLAHGVLGYSYLRQTKYDLAEQEYQQVLRLQPDNLVALTNLGHIYFDRRQYRRAVAAWEKAVHLFPQNSEIRVRLAYLYIGLSRFRQAILHLNRMLFAKPVLFKIYPLYTAALVKATVVNFERLNVLLKVGILLIPYLIALWTPLVFNTSVGVILSLYSLISILVFTWFRDKKYDDTKILIWRAFLFYLFYCLIYWGIVYIRHF